MTTIPTLPEEQFAPGNEGCFVLDGGTYRKQPGISRSMIVELLRITPAHAQTLIDGTWSKPSTMPMTGGNLFDRALLEPETFIEGQSHWVIPAGMKLTTVDGRAWRKDHPGSKEWADGDDGLPYLPAVSDSATVLSAENVKGMIESVLRHTKARYIVEAGVKQESAFCLDKDTGLMRKVRPEARIWDNNSRIVLADVKSTFRGGAVREAWIKHCARMAYHIQDSYSSDVYRDLFERPLYVFIDAAMQ